MAVTFPAEVIEIKAKKLASGDRSYRIILETDNPECLQLQKYIAEQVVMIKVEGKDG